MTVTVRLLSKIPKIIPDTVEIELFEGATILNVIEKLAYLYGNEIEEKIYNKKTGGYMVEFMVNLKHELPTKVLNDGDEITILPFMVGG
jgi:molybdopterin converting factor small subunit